MNPNAIFVERPAPKRRSLYCSHCRENISPTIDYVRHVLGCIAKAIATWSEEGYAERYFKQVRAISRFRQIGQPKRRSRFKAWNWWLKPNGAPLVEAEFTSDERLLREAGIQ